MSRKGTTNPENDVSTKNIYLVEQDVSELYGDYLTETVVVATTAEKAKEAASILGDEMGGGSFGLTVYPDRLKVTLLGPLAGTVFHHQARFSHKDNLILVVGKGNDYDA